MCDFTNLFSLQHPITLIWGFDSLKHLSIQLILNKTKITQVFDRDEFHFHFSFVFSFPRNFLSKHGELPNVCILVVWSSPIFPSTPGTEIDFLWTKHFDYKTISKLTKTHLKKSNKKVRTKLPQTLMMTWFIFLFSMNFKIKWMIF